VSYSITPVVNYVSTLVIDVNASAAEQLADQLNHSGFAADTATSCAAALRALRARYYGSMVFVGDVSDPQDLKCIADLRRQVPRTWMIMISATKLHDRRELFLRYGVDALLVTPFSMEDLSGRLLAFSMRSRPL
jgi:DNA-binding response OmpR family regulator